MDWLVNCFLTRNKTVKALPHSTSRFSSLLRQYRCVYVWSKRRILSAVNAVHLPKYITCNIAKRMTHSNACAAEVWIWPVLISPCMHFRCFRGWNYDGAANGHRGACRHASLDAAAADDDDAAATAYWATANGCSLAHIVACLLRRRHASFDG